MGLRFDQIVDKSVPSDFRVEFGATDITELVETLEIERPLPDIRLPQLWSGSIRIIQPINLAAGRCFGVESQTLASFEIDPQLNNDWKAFGTPIKIFADGRYICVLRCLEDLKYDFTTGTGTANIGHIIRAFSSQKPKQTTGFEIGSSFNAFGGEPDEILGVLPARKFAEKLVEQAVDADGDAPTFTLSTSGLSDFLENTFTFGGAPAVNGYDTDPLPQERNLAEILHEIFWVNYGVALTNQTGDTENLKVSGEYPCFQGTLAPTLIIPAQQLDISVELTSLDRPSTVAETSASILQALQVKRDEFPKIWDSATGVPPSGGDPVTAEETEMDEPNISADTTTTTFTKRSPEWFLVSESTATSVITLTETHTETSDSQGRPLTFEILADLTRSQLTRMDRFPELREAALANRDTSNSDITSAVIVPDAYRELTTWTYDNEGHKESITRQIFYPEQYVLRAGTGDGSTESYRRIIRYERIDRSNLNPEWQETQQELVARGAIDPNNEDSEQLTGKPGSVVRNQKIDGVPQPQYKRREKPLKFQSFKEDAFSSTFGSETSARRLDISSRYATSGERLSKTAELMLCINQQTRPEALDIKMALPDTADDLEPFNIYHLGTGRKVNRTAISCVRCGPRILYRSGNEERSEVEFAFTAYRLGDVSPAPEPIKIPVQPSTYLLPLTIGSLEDREGATCLTVGVAITPIELSAFEGTPPYTFSAPGGLPAGLSISGNQIIGTPTTVAASTTYTIQVDDNVAAMDTTTLDIEICAVAIPDPHYALTKRAVFRQPTRTASVLVDAGCNVVVGTDNIIIGTDNVISDCTVETFNVLVGTDNVVVGTDNVVSTTVT